MKKEAFDTLEVAEGSWWDRGRQAAIRSVLRGKYDKALDYGAGFGSQLGLLKEYARLVDAFEPAGGLQGELRQRGYARVFKDSKEELSERYDLIALLDVLEHVEDHVALARNLGNALAPNGVLIITVPAYPWLWSEHDTLNMHFRRYTRTSLTTVLQKAGFEIDYLGHWNMMLLIPLALVRFLGSTGKGGLELPPLLNGILVAWLRLEALVLKYVPLPFGVSLIARVRKPAPGPFL